jgi:hypothetical protein
MANVIVGVDLGKNLCSVVGLDADGAVLLRRTMRRQTVTGFVSKLPPCVVARRHAAARIIVAASLLRRGTT